MTKLSVLEYLQKHTNGTLSAEDTTHMHYPTAISRTLDMRITAIDTGQATIAINASSEKHGNQQGTIHGGLIAELADAAIGTAHSTLMKEGETFATLELKINFFRPSWENLLHASAKPIQQGKTITHYACEITREDGKTIATALSIIMTLRHESTRGR